MARTRVTLDQVAVASNASPATVSLALRNKPGVSRETRERVLAAAHSLGYQMKIRAGRDVNSALLNVALVFRTWSLGPERSSPALNPFYSWVLTGIQEAGTEASMNLLLGTIPVDANNNPLDIPMPLLRQPLDGVLLVGSHRTSTVDSVIEMLGDPRPPVVLVDAEDPAHVLDSVTSDNYGGAYRATTHLIDQGHTRIGYAGALSDWEPNFQLRLSGFRQALADRGLEPAIIQESSSYDRDVSDLSLVLEQATACFCGNDEIALILLRIAAAQGISIPDAFSIIGFDDTSLARDANPPLTTIAVDKLSLGRLAVALLEYRLRWADSAPINTVLAPRLILRKSIREVTPRD